MARIFKLLGTPSTKHTTRLRRATRPEPLFYLPSGSYTVTLFAQEKAPPVFPAGRGGRHREQRELRTAARVFILRQRLASGKDTPFSAQNLPDAIG